MCGCVFVFVRVPCVCVRVWCMPVLEHIPPEDCLHVPLSPFSRYSPPVLSLALYPTFFLSVPVCLNPLLILSHCPANTPPDPLQKRIMPSPMQSHLQRHTQYQSFKTEGPGFGEKSCEGVLFASLSLLQSTSDCLQVNPAFALPLPLARLFCVSHCSCLSPGYF